RLQRVAERVAAVLLPLNPSLGDRPGWVRVRHRAPAVRAVDREVPTQVGGGRRGGLVDRALEHVTLRQRGKLAPGARDQQALPVPRGQVPLASLTHPEREQRPTGLAERG